MWPVPNYTPSIIEWASDLSPMKARVIGYINFPTRRAKDVTNSSS